MAFATRLCILYVGLVLSLLYTSSKCTDPDTSKGRFKAFSVFNLRVCVSFVSIELLYPLIGSHSLPCILDDKKLDLASLLKVFNELPPEDLKLLSTHVDDPDPEAFEGILATLSIHNKELTADFISYASQHRMFIKGIIEASQLMSKADPVTMETTPSTELTIEPSTELPKQNAQLSIDQQVALLENLSLALLHVPPDDLHHLMDVLTSKDEPSLKELLVKIQATFPKITNDLIDEAIKDTMTLRSAVEVVLATLQSPKQDAVPVQPILPELLAPENVTTVSSGTKKDITETLTKQEEISECIENIGCTC